MTSSAKDEFMPGDAVIYPTHGLGYVKRVGPIFAAGYQATVIEVVFTEGNKSLSIPENLAISSGLRKPHTIEGFQAVLGALVGSSEAGDLGSLSCEDYMLIVNSGDPIQIAELVNFLYVNQINCETTKNYHVFSEALNRLAVEASFIYKVSMDDAIKELNSIVSSSEKHAI
jgi:CarD family transcriptional regulator